MKRFQFTALAHVKITVVADSKMQARGLIFDNLDDADTNYIRHPAYWPTDNLLAEFSLSQVECTTPADGGS